MTEKIFVFGSNTGGIHGAGAARHAYDNEGAVWGQGFGHYGNSFAIPTKGVFKGHGGRLAVGNTLPSAKIEGYVRAFLRYANANPQLEFKVTRIGCGLAGLYDADVAPMFYGAPSNCHFDTLWKPIFDDLKKVAPQEFNPGYWGSF